MKLQVVLLFLAVVYIQGNNAQQECFNGTRSFSNGTIVYNDTKLIQCEQDNSICAIFKMLVDYEGKPMYSETGVCVPKVEEMYYNCDSAKAKSEYDVYKCGVEFCEESGCNTLSEGGSNVCIVGTRAISAQGKWTFDNTTVIMCPPDSVCGLYKAHTMTNGEEVYNATGLCVPRSDQVNYCTPEENKTNGTVLFCNVTFCDGIACNKMPDVGKHVCFAGSRVFVNDMVVQDNVTAVRCPFDNAICGLYRIKVNEAYVESGVCIYKEMTENYTCATAKKWSGTNFTSCNVTKCDGFACNRIKTPSTCEKTPSDDLQVFPSCTLKQTLDKSMTCFVDLFSGYPYKEKSTCRSNLDKAVSCMSAVMHECLGGSCSTILDDIPYFRHILKAIANQTKSIHKLSDALDLLNLEKCTQSMIYDTVCPSPGEVPSLPDMSSMMDLNQEIPFCDNDVFKHMVMVGMTATKAFYNAETRQDVCMAAQMYGVKMQQLWKTKCSLEALRHFLSDMLTGHDAKYVDYIIKAVHITFEFFSNMELPNCSGMMENPCDRLYETGRACDLRKAWICDYVHWKITLFKDWMKSAKKWAQDNMMMEMSDMEMPACSYEWSENLCVDDSQLRCVSGGDGCPICLCQDHEYTNLAHVAKMWRKDYKTWHAIMRKYTMIFNNETC